MRGIIHLPIIGAAETFRWGVWGSLSPENFETLMKMDDDPKRIELPPMFSWLKIRIAEYPDTLSLKDVRAYPRTEPAAVFRTGRHPIIHFHRSIARASARNA